MERLKKIKLKRKRGKGLRQKGQNRLPIKINFFYNANSLTAKARHSVSRLIQAINYHNIALMCSTIHFILHANVVASAFSPFIGH